MILIFQNYFPLNLDRESLFHTLESETVLNKNSTKDMWNEDADNKTKAKIQQNVLRAMCCSGA